MGYEYYPWNSPLHRCVDYTSGYWGIKTVKLHSLKIPNSTLMKPLRYNHDWNWLMMVVKKIDNTENIFMDEYPTFNQYPFSIRIEGNECEIIVDNDADKKRGFKHNFPFKKHICETSKNAVYESVVEFIKFYNEI